MQRPKEKDKGQKKRTDDTKAKRKGQMIQRPNKDDQKKRTDDTKAKRKGQMIQTKEKDG